MHLSDVDHFPDALSQAANRWVGVESVPTFNRSVDETFWRNILAKKKTKYLGQKHRRQKTFSQKRTIYLCKKEHICQNQRYKVLLLTNLNTKYLCKKNNRQNLFAEEVPTFFTKNANSVKASSVRHCGCYLSKSCHVHSTRDFLSF